MEDRRIIDLFFARDESAIGACQLKYGKYCHCIAYNVLASEQDAEECVNDTYLAAWNSIPPSKPNSLKAFLGRITRNISLNRYHHERAQKRSAPITVIMEEAEEFIPDPSSENCDDELVLRDAINTFLATLSSQARIVFVKRYWYFSSIEVIARELHITEASVKVTLHRTRKKLKSYLETKGITV